MKIAVFTPEIHLADCKYNTELIKKLAQDASDAGCKTAVFPELSVCGVSCGDLIKTKVLLSAACEAVSEIKEASLNWKDLLLEVGFPFEINEKIYSCAAVIKDGNLLGIVPNSNHIGADTVEFDNMQIPFGNLNFEVDGKSLKVLIGNFPDTEGVKADIILNPCALQFVAGFKRNVFSKLKKSSGDTCLISASAGIHESTDECVYSGLKSIFKNGHEICAVTSGDTLFTDTDEIGIEDEPLTPLYFKDNFFIPEDPDAADEICLDAMKIQAIALNRRMKKINAQKIVLGLSGGLDSSLALLAAVNACDMAGRDRKNIICISMPGFGTVTQTKNNAENLAQFFGVSFETIDIKDSVSMHLSLIGQPLENDGKFKQDIVFENAQARTRTMILMDMANKCNGIVLGTGDMSEFALGWCTYNGDQMSMYAINSGIPKTVIKYIFETYVNKVADKETAYDLEDIFEEIINTPVSPELLENDGDNILQKTEDIIGPYELHDLFMGHFLKENRKPDVIVGRVYDVFRGQYSMGYLKKCAKIFFTRFFTEAFKRSSMPTGPDIFGFSLSPRKGFCIPSDAYHNDWTNLI